MNRAPLAIVPLLLASGGCSLALTPGEAQCETAADCAARGFTGAVCTDQVCTAPPEPPDPMWGCLGKVTEPVPDPTKRVDLSIHLTFASDGGPVSDATVDVCDKLDLDCTGTNPNFPKGLKPASDGLMKLSVVQGFDGFVRIIGMEIVDSRVYVGRPLIKPPAAKEVQLLRPTEYNFLATAAHLTPDPTRGTAILLAVDCQGESASGVRFESPNADDKSAAFYLINQSPTSPPAATKTDVDGFGGYFNLPTGTSVARSYRAKENVFVGESSFQIVANTISYVQIAPTPN